MATTMVPRSTDGVDPKIEELQLADIARSAAYKLKAEFPDIKFTSGRRTLVRQAAAMAENVALKRRWIERTYAPSSLRTQCQDWVDRHPQVTAQEEIAVGLLEVFKHATTEELNHFSKHLSGMAFDIKPMLNAPHVIATIKALPGLRMFLEKEGGLVRWHAEF
ncbi:hypothetical protein K2O51_33585 (plasmid) [Cupriavidus pinatubonensis]|uniref:hypothetical protein n=1 Tax=Cupriavidus pinatubonensis TaxID=248026 RepID=UPI001C72ADDF|nr:hypothetical protein [Cupriavidus pinatubonensis]QYY33780.1 hypothetical protein K2O51_33585 [Cupriavidus pinatubonensis]